MLGGERLELGRGVFELVLGWGEVLEFVLVLVELELV